MSQRINARVIAAILGAVSMVGCGQAPLSPTAPAAALGSAAASGQVGALSGTYELGFLKETRAGLQPIEGTLNVGEYLVLKASVRDGAGLLAGPRQAHSVWSIPSRHTHSARALSLCALGVQDTLSV